MKVPSTGSRGVTGRVSSMALTREVGDDRLARVLVAAVLVVLAAALLFQLGDTAFLRGDGDLYLRDAARFADGAIPRSRYSPGFGLFLSPILLVTGDDPVMAGNVSLVVIAAIAVAAFALVYRLLRAWLPPLVAAGAVAMLAVGQGVVTYFAEVRPEALMLLLLTAMFLALRNERGWFGLALGALAILVRVAVAPVVVVTFLVWAWRRPRLLATAAVLFGLAVGAHFATQPSADQDYLEIGGRTFAADSDASTRLESAFGTGREGVVAYGRYALPRFVWPYRVLQSPAGIVVGPLTTVAMAGGLVLLVLRRAPGARPSDDRLLRAIVLGSSAYLAALLIWPIRQLAAVRLAIPVAPVPVLGLGVAVLVVSGWLRPRSTGALPIAVIGGLATVAFLGGATAVRDHARDSRADAAFVRAHLDARDRLPSGPVISEQAGATELLTGRTAFELPLRQDIADFARRVGACTFVVTPDLGDDVVRWIDDHRRAILSANGSTELVALDEPWCRRSLAG